MARRPRLPSRPTRSSWSRPRTGSAGDPTASAAIEVDRHPPRRRPDPAGRTACPRPRGRRSRTRSSSSSKVLDDLDDADQQGRQRPARPMPCVDCATSGGAKSGRGAGQRHRAGVAAEQRRQPERDRGARGHETAPERAPTPEEPATERDRSTPPMSHGPLGRHGRRRARQRPRPARPTRPPAARKGQVRDTDGGTERRDAP